MKARAKINLTLDICSKLENGYHEISSVMQTVSLCDSVKVRRAKEITVIDNSDIKAEDNLCFKAALKFFEYTKIKGGAAIKIKKRIPLSAGLGGGSADAAAVLIALNRIYKTKLNVKELEKIALAVGADVPYLITGKTAKVGGIGEKVTALPKLQRHYIVLIKEAQKQSTAKSYSDFDTFGKSLKRTEDFCKALEKNQEWYSFVGNDFLSVTPQSALINEAEQQNPLCVSLSGSGPTVFALFKSRREAKRAAKALARPGRTVITARFS